MKIAIIGSGLSGLTCAYLLQNKFNVKVYEKNPWIGGHAKTLELSDNGKDFKIDMDFACYNDKNHPILTALINHFSVNPTKIQKKFGVKVKKNGFEFSPLNFNSFFANRINLLSPKYWKLYNEIKLFKKNAKLYLKDADFDIRVDEYLESGGYSKEFIDYYFIPLVSTIWCMSPLKVHKMFAFFVIEYLSENDFLEKDDSTWHSFPEGSRAFIELIAESLKEKVLVKTPVLEVQRFPEHVMVITEDKKEKFDYVIMATHSDEAVSILKDANFKERDILERISYTKNEIIIHADDSLLANNKRARGIWNYFVNGKDLPLLTYDINKIHNLTSKTPYLASLNQSNMIDEAKVIDAYYDYYPIYDEITVRAVKHYQEINGDNRTFYCGSYWKYGTLEDAAETAINVVDHLDPEVGKTILKKR